MFCNEDQTSTEDISVRCFTDHAMERTEKMIATHTDFLRQRGMRPESDTGSSLRLPVWWRCRLNFWMLFPPFEVSGFCLNHPRLVET